MPVRRQRRPDYTALNSSVYEINCPKEQIDKTYKQTGGTCPMANAKLISEYLPIFVKFIKTIDFTDL